MHYCHGWMGKGISDALTQAGVPHEWLKDSASKRKLSAGEPTVKVLTMHSSKGLEFPTVVTAGIGALGGDGARQREDAKLLYVAMTRATENLLLTSSKASPFAEKLQRMAELHREAVA
ncbi:MAG: 3'-5' exonuclease [Pseudomonadota bacterium]